MKKFSLFVDMEKEEQYLNEMAKQGWHLDKYSVFNVYTFVKEAPQVSNYKIDYQLFRKKSDYINFLTLFADSGWRHISGSQNSDYQFFLPDSSQNQSAEIFSDGNSSNQRYKRLYRQAVTWGTLMFFYFFCYSHRLRVFLHGN